MALKVRMTPHLSDFDNAASGIRTVVEKYFKHLPNYDIELVSPKATSFDVWAIHAGTTQAFAPNDPIVAHSHGLYWTADYQAQHWELQGNQEVINTVRHARRVTVPSRWVAEAFARDMHLYPAVIPHGVDWEEWQGGEDLGYILWNKNRTSDACSPAAVNELALRHPREMFLTTFADARPTPNIKETGAVSHRHMRQMVLGAAVYLATAKETFGIGTLEAMAAGKPVLGFDWGGTADLVKHGYAGYLARPGDYDDLAVGLDYCLKHRKALGRNAQRVAMAYSWEITAQQVAEEYARTVDLATKRHGVAVVIPCFNKADTLERAVKSAINQTRKPNVIVIVDNNSSDDFKRVSAKVWDEAEGVEIRIFNCTEQGVAHARNAGIASVPDADYIVCLDADDEIEPAFIATCARALDADNALALAYTRLVAVTPDGTRTVPDWPGAYRFDDFLEGRNPVPTCNMFRRIFWERLGGFRQRYAPNGAGAEDAEFWLRIGAAGGNAALVSQEPLFVYHLGGAVSGNDSYQEVDWRSDKPWMHDGQHPFASLATPANGLSHLVRQYDEPAVSIVIPVGPGHAQYLTDILDSIEAQSFRQWEAIVVDNTLDPVERGSIQALQRAYPFARWSLSTVAGAGRARNFGASMARAPLLLFVDADDWLSPHALEVMIAAYKQHPGEIVYSDYFGYAYIDDPKELARLQRADRLAHHDPETKRTVIRYHAAEYDCEMALRQPDPSGNFYIWNIVSSLVPRQHFLDVGGFDEEMPSWEDWDLWLRMAQQGHCFTRVAEPLVHYRFYSGQRRALANPGESGDDGRQLSSKLLEYMTEKYKRSENMPGCRSCGGARRTSHPPSAPATSLNEGRVAQMSAGDLVEVELIDGNIGEHLVAFSQVSYGYRKHGERFKMQESHAKLDRRVRIVSESEKAAAQPILVPHKQQEPLPPPPGSDADEDASPIKISSEGNLSLAVTNPDAKLHVASGNVGFGASDSAGAAPSEGKEEKKIVIKSNAYKFQDLWGIDEEREKILLDAGIRSINGLLATKPERLAELLDVPETMAKNILSRAEKEKK